MAFPDIETLRELREKDTQLPWDKASKYKRKLQALTMGPWRPERGPGLPALSCSCPS